MTNQPISRIGFMMEQALGAMTSTLAAEFMKEGIDLPHSQYAVLRLIYTHDGLLTQIRIAEILKKDAAAIKRTIDILEKKGFVTREAQSGRSNYVTCTEKALRLKNIITDIANRTLLSIFGTFTDDELNIFTDILGKIAASRNG